MKRAAKRYLRLVMFLTSKLYDAVKIMKIKLLATLFFVVLFVVGAGAQESYSGRDFSGIKADFKTVGAVVHVKIKTVELAAEGAHSLYKVESEVVETFNGKTKKGQTLTFYFDAEDGYDAQQLAGKEWVVFLEKQGPVPNGGNGWYELENSKVPASAKLDARLRKLKGSTKKG